MFCIESSLSVCYTPPMLRRVRNLLGFFFIASASLLSVSRADPAPDNQLNPRALIGHYNPSEFVIDGKTQTPDLLDLQEIKIDYDRMNRNLFSRVTASRRADDEGGFFLEVFRNIDSDAYVSRARVSDGCVDMKQTTRIFGRQLTTRIEVAKLLACAVETHRTWTTYTLIAPKDDPAAITFLVNDSQTPGRTDRYSFRRAQPL